MKQFLWLLLIVSNSIVALAQEEWTPISSLPNDFQTDHSFGFSLNGKGYLVTGATFEGPTRSFYEYDPELDTWEQKGDFFGGARSYGIGDTWEGVAYFGFGRNEETDLNDLWAYNVDYDVWLQLADCPCSPRIHPAFIAHQGKIFVGLGGDETGDLKDWWEYDIASNTWEQKPDYPGQARHHPYQFAVGDYVYTGFGHSGNFYGRDWYRYDPKTEEWEQMADIPGEGRVAGTQFSHNGKGYILSGEGDGHGQMDFGEFWEYDPNGNTWTELEPHPGKSRWAPASFIINNEVYFMNGVDYSVGTEGVTLDNYKFQLDPIDFEVGLNESTVEEIQIISTPLNNTIQLVLPDQPDHIAVSIYNTTGHLVHQQTSNDAMIDCSNFSSGLYLVEVKVGEKLFTGRFVRK